jgi:hypothetical protein
MPFDVIEEVSSNRPRLDIEVDLPARKDFSTARPSEQLEWWLPNADWFAPQSVERCLIKRIRFDQRAVQVDDKRPA